MRATLSENFPVDDVRLLPRELAREEASTFEASLGLALSLREQASLSQVIRCLRDTVHSDRGAHSFPDLALARILSAMFAISS
jgi:hypothetical protein